MSIVLSRQTTEYPCYMHHGSEKPKLVTTKEEAEKLSRDGWSRSYIAQAFPKTKYRSKGVNAAGETVLDIKHVESAEDEAKLGAGWYDTPGEVPVSAEDKDAKIAALKAQLYDLDPSALSKTAKAPLEKA